MPGAMTAEAAEADRRAHAITRWLGADAPEERYPVTTVRPVRPWPPRALLRRALELRAGRGASSRALIAALPPADAPAIEHRSCAHADRARPRGGHDNVTVAVVDVDPTDRDRPREGA